MALILSGVRYAKMSAASAVTRQRMEAALQAITRLGQVERGTATLALQTSIPTLGGTALFARSQAERPPAMVPQPSNAVWHRCFPDPSAVSPGHATVAAVSGGRPLVMAYPWGKNRLYEIREDWYAGPLGLPNPTSATGPAPLTAEQAELWRKPEPHRLRELWPRASEAILLRAGVLTAASAYRDDRRPGQPWNDAWGNPLVVAYAIYQPPECGLTTLANDGSRVFPRDRYLRAALDAYQFNRAMYVSMGSGGPILAGSHLPSGVPTGADEAAFAEVCDGLWRQVCETTMAEPAKVWDETSFLRPPWDGVLRVDGKLGNEDVTCFISAPLEIK
jgi:hypothetical protein